MKQTISITSTASSLLSLLQQMEIPVSADCGGKGSCGKCRVHITCSPAVLPVSKAEKRVFSAAQLQGGWRLACMQKALSGMIVELETAEDEIAVEAGFLGAAAGFADGRGNTSAVLQEGCMAMAGENAVAAIAIDIGTTTLAAALVDTVSGNVKKTATSVNHQRRFGADVISRIEAANRGEEPALMRAVRNDIRHLTGKLGVSAKQAVYVIAGNTTMEHLLLGLPCETLGVAPYTPVDISLHTVGNMTILPGISTYVGADIVSGIIACGMDTDSTVSLLVDLGTNGEMAIGNRDKIMATSTAAGPAFEGGNISCGMAGVPGAIDSVSLQDGTVHVTTIGNKEAAGLCGSGVVEITYELLKNKLVDETGLLDDEYFEGGFPVADGVVFTQKDIREIQLAKSAIRAGMETLAHCYGVSLSDVSTLYLAGGFGKKINIRKAAGIGLFPKELLDRTKAVGNSSLAGAVLYAANPSLKERFIRVGRDAEEVQLAETKEFTDAYMEHMFFPETD